MVKPFLAEMDLALGAATAAVSRAGASSLAELAALRLPSLLVPYPAAADQHQLHNALAFAGTGAARMLEQERATAGNCLACLMDLVDNEPFRAGMRRAGRGGIRPGRRRTLRTTILNAIARRADEPPAGRRALPGLLQGHRVTTMETIWKNRCPDRRPGRGTGRLRYAGDGHPPGRTAGPAHHPARRAGRRTSMWSRPPRRNWRPS